MSKVIVIADLHEPYCRKGYFEFCKDIYKKYRCNTVVFIGDIVDSHSVSFHIKHPELPNSAKEYELALAAVQKWYQAFPKAKICIGNHDSRIVRVAQSVNIPSQLLKSYNDTWKTKNWIWDWNFNIDNVHYCHGNGTGESLYPAFTAVRKMAMSVVMGHYHSSAGIKWLVNPYMRLFGMDVGAGCNDEQLAFAYNQFNKIRSVIGCGIVLNGIPYFEIAPIGKGEKYHQSNFKE